MAIQQSSRESKLLTVVAGEVENRKHRLEKQLSRLQTESFREPRPKCKNCTGGQHGYGHGCTPKKETCQWVKRKEKE